MIRRLPECTLFPTRRSSDLKEIATGKIPGAILLIQQHGKPVYFETFGMRDVAARSPMTRDAIFRLYSMSKPITSVVDRKSTRLNSSHANISYAVFCLKKKKD